MRTLPVRNTTDMLIPAYAAMMVIGWGYIDKGSNSSYAQVALVAQPDDNGLSDSQIVFNGPTPILAGANGTAIGDFPCAAAYSQSNTDGSDPVVGDVWGTRSGEWVLFHGYEGFRIQQASTSGVTMVVPNSVRGADYAIALSSSQIYNGVYAVTLTAREQVNFVLGQRAWAIDFANSPSGTLTSGEQYPANRLRDTNSDPVNEAGGIFLVNLIDEASGQSLTDITAFAPIFNPDDPITWSAGTFPYGAYVSHSGHFYLCTNVAGTSGTPGSSGDWTQADTLEYAGGYDPNAVYRYDATTTTDYVQEVLPILGFRSTPLPQGGLSNLDTIIALTAATFTIPAVSSTVSVEIEPSPDTSVWMVIGQTILITDGTHIVYGSITAIADETHFTFKTSRDATTYTAWATDTAYAVDDEREDGGDPFTCILAVPDAYDGATMYSSGNEVQDGNIAYTYSNGTPSSGNAAERDLLDRGRGDRATGVGVNLLDRRGDYGEWGGSHHQRRPGCDHGHHQR